MNYQLTDIIRELEPMIKKAVQEVYNDFLDLNNIPERIITPNQVYKRYRITYSRQNRLVENGILIRTIDNQINERSVILYLRNQESEPKQMAVSKKRKEAAAPLSSKKTNEKLSK